MQQILASLSEESSKIIGEPIFLTIGDSGISPDVSCNFPLSDQNGKKYFCKCITEKSILIAEFEGLKEIASTHTIFVPKPICIIQHINHSYGLFQYLDFTKTTNTTEFELGAQIAKMHQNLSNSGLYGYEHDNFIGLTPQFNGWYKDWSDFFIERRLKPQFEFAKFNHIHSNSIDIDSFLDIVKELLKNHKPPPSLLHGDLWSGNKDILSDGTPAIFDPAVYYGDRETDIAMTHLFNIDIYLVVLLKNKDFEDREDIYLLYHVLNHANMFGSPYNHDAISIIRRIIKHSGKTSPSSTSKSTDL
ncbi:hypothetical protein WA158_002890 [Blastocystis sp. Blastoise]